MFFFAHVLQPRVRTGRKLSRDYSALASGQGEQGGFPHEGPKGPHVQISALTITWATVLKIENTGHQDGLQRAPHTLNITACVTSWSCD